MRTRAYLFIAMLYVSFGLTNLYAQEAEPGGISTQEVLVVKSYTPSLSDAFKINGGPKIPDSLKGGTKVLTFKIKPVAVVSTFEPNKATPLKLKKRYASTPFNTFFSGGFGTLNQAYLNVSSVIELDRTQRFGLNFYRDGFGADVGDSVLKSSQSFSQFGTHHNLQSNTYNVNTQLQFTTQRNNYFGLYNRNWDDFLLGSINPEVARNYFKFRTYWDWFDSVVRSLSFQANVNSDNFATSEQQLLLGANFTAPFADGKLQASTEVQGQNSYFKESFYENQSQEYTFGLGKINLEWLYSKNNLKLKLGAGVAYVEGDETLTTKLKYYPALEVFYQKKKSQIAPYLTAQGGVQLATYRESALYNPYIAPSTSLRTTFTKYNAVLGVRSSLSSVLNFNFGLLYDQVENYQFYQRLPLKIKGNTDAYRLSNAFENQFANVDLYGVKAQIRIDLAKNNFVHFETAYRHFELDDTQKLYNIPALQMSWKSQFRYKNLLTLAFNGEVWGNRPALEHVILQSLSNESIYTEEINLPLFFRSTAHLTLRLNEQFDAFVKGKFTNSELHGQWGYFQEPSLILLGGITYKFDFQY